ncbi:hypothetical protein MUN88_06650 [Gracilibacillus caseinilyticus]|uniref:Uncharacterized protein n=1 Tax=Gracilibacillus caseinilyticus TaxID=2932256 RepID=A0ABY4EZQ3_9BACI|nr:hypothetical protein [Gracilibacillus caseinilyticus]UOQ49753.1 hypothetical protein MUN88_06650 [Gracilibacillus caseinilyticus]
MNRTLVGISLLFIAAFIYASKLISTAILVASYDIINSANWAAMLDMAPAAIDIVIWISLILGSLLIILEECLKLKN